jgi:hypothetical protein
MLVDHITVQIPSGQMDEAEDLLEEVGFERTEIDSAYKDTPGNQGFSYRHYKDQTGFRVHTIETPAGFTTPEAGYTHFRVVVATPDYERLGKTPWCARDSGSGRIWLEGLGTLRIEVTTPKGLTPTQRDRLIGNEPPLPKHLLRHKAILAEAMQIMTQRDESYGDQWKRYGWRGALFNLRRKAERAWHTMFNEDPEHTIVLAHKCDDLLDVINYAAMAMQMAEESNRDGVPEWWNVQG